MATTLHFTPPFSLSKPKLLHLTPPFRLPSTSSISRTRHLTITHSYKVLVEHQGKTTELNVDPDETILSKALDEGMDVPHDCKLGVCMTCPAKLLSGEVDQSDGMLSDDVIERGYVLVCAAYPKSDCHVRLIPEEELLSLQLATAND